MDQREILRILMPERTAQIALAWSILHDAQSAEDAYQDMLTRVLEQEHPFEGPRHLRGWSWKVLRHRCYEVRRKQQYQVGLLDESVLEQVDSELESRDAEEITQRSLALRHCLAGLTNRARQTIELRYFRGLRGDQLAQELGQKPATVYKTLQRTYAKLLDCIRVQLEHPEPGDVSP